jgi:DNA-binding winged helix-turn-helix (wHTH) protein
VGEAHQFPVPSDATLVFGSCSLDLASARLKRDGRNIPLTPKAFAVLRYLVEHAGRLITKQELFDAIWTDVFVGDAALKVCIREIRRALEDDAQEPRYVETAHRRGYRFIAPVTLTPALSARCSSVA